MLHPEESDDWPASFSQSAKSNPDDPPLGFNALQLIEGPLPTAGADLARLPPGVRATEIGIPERPGSALPRSCGVDQTAARTTIKEHAVAVGELDKALSDPNPADVSPLELRDVIDPQEARNFGDFLVVHPYDARCARAAIATLGALEPQTLVVPRFFIHSCSARQDRSPRQTLRPPNRPDHLAMVVTSVASDVARRSICISVFHGPRLARTVPPRGLVPKLW